MLPPSEWPSSVTRCRPIPARVITARMSSMSMGNPHSLMYASVALVALKYPPNRWPFTVTARVTY
jgi:hypothetical protein